MGIADNLEKAAVLIAGSGWGQRQYLNRETGCYCLMGALYAAKGVDLGRNVPDANPDEVIPLARVMGWKDDPEERSGADEDGTDLVVSQIDAAASFVIQANDAPTYCKEQAVADLNAAAKLARGES